MEKEFKIPIQGTKLNIYAKQYGSLNAPVVVFVHGLSGHMDEHIFYNGARVFHQHGISSVRFNLYGGERDARDLVECTLETHAHDLNVVITYLQQQHPLKLFAVGHSYGGPTILLAQHNSFDAIVFWDASFDNRLIDSKSIDGKKLRYMEWGVWPLIGDEMYQEAQKLDGRKLISNLTVPLKVITAEKSYYKERLLNYELAKEPKAYHMVKGASHNFNEEGAAEELYKESLNWIEKFN